MKKYPKSKEGWNQFNVELNDQQLLIGNWQVMHEWEKPLMKRLAKEVTWNNGHILEIGFGMGISASYIMEYGCKSYTVIEPHPIIIEAAKKWALKYDIEIKIIEGFWQNIIPTLNFKFDGVLFDTFPLNKKERHENHYSFIPISKELLNPLGVLVYYSDEKIPFRTKHLNIVLENYEDIRLIKVKDLIPPGDCEYWKHNYMIIPICKNI